MRKYNQGVADSNRRRTKHGGTTDARHGGTDPMYKVWVSIKGRCFNPEHKAYHRYGGRGITMHPKWVDDFAAFKKYMGERPKGATIERKNNDKGYVPGNVVWATRKQQASNRCTNVMLTYQGQTKSLAAWAEHLGWKYGLLASRWKKGVRGDALFAPPKYARNVLYTYKGKTMTLPKWAEETGIPYTTLVWRLKHNKPML